MIYSLLYPTDAAAYAAQMKFSTLQTWLRRNEEIGVAPVNSTEARRLELDETQQQGGGSQGKRRMWSFRNIIEIAIANYLFTNGDIELERALYAGSTFAYTGTMPGNMAVDTFADPKSHDPMRMPGFPFFDPAKPNLRTFGYLSKSGCTIVGVGDGYEPEREALMRLGHPKVWTVFDCDEVFLQVCQHLGLRPNIVLEDAYRDNP